MNDAERPWPAPPGWLNDTLSRRFYADLHKDSRPPRQILPELRGHSAVEVARWIEALCNELGTSPAALAKDANLAASTLNRFRRQIETGANISARSIEKIRQAAESRLTALSLFQGHISEHLEEAEKNIRESDPGFLNPSVDLTCDYPHRYISVYGYVRGNIRNYKFYTPRLDRQWRDASVTVPLHYHLNGTYLGFVYEDDEGSGSNFVSGEIVVGVLLCTTVIRPRIGSQVIAFRRNDDLIECGAWRLDYDPAGRFWLMPLDHKSPKEGVFLGDSINGNLDRVYVALLVVSSISEVSGVF